VSWLLVGADPCRCPTKVVRLLFPMPGFFDLGQLTPCRAWLKTLQNSKERRHFLPLRAFQDCAIVNIGDLVSKRFRVRMIEIL
jgi:hypothetical protein